MPGFSRRQLFAALGAVALAPGELWTPSRKIFLPPPGGWTQSAMVNVELFNEFWNSVRENIAGAVGGYNCCVPWRPA